MILIAKITNYLIIRSPSSKISKTIYKIQLSKKSNLIYLYIICFVTYIIKLIQKNLVKRSKKYALLDYEGNSIFYLYNLIKECIIRTNDVYFINKYSNILNLDKVIRVYKLERKR